MEKLRTITEIFDQKNEDYQKMEQNYDLCRKVLNAQEGYIRNERGRE